MDAFEQWMTVFWEASVKQRGILTGKKRAVCICPACPAYNRCAQETGESVYCITGKSHLCITEDRGCSCKVCSLVPELGLRYHAFCQMGGESAQRYEHELH